MTRQADLWRVPLMVLAIPPMVPILILLMAIGLVLIWWDAVFRGGKKTAAWWTPRKDG